MNLKAQYTDEKTGIHYTLHGDYYLPDLKIPEGTIFEIRRFGRLHRQFLLKHHKVRYTNLLVSGSLNAYLHEIDELAEKQMNVLIGQYAELENVSEKLKSSDPMAWVKAMNSIRNRAEEFVLHDLIYV